MTTDDNNLSPFHPEAPGMRSWPKGVITSEQQIATEQAKFDQARGQQINPGPVTTDNSGEGKKQ
jgi:hypothetical protein